MCVRIQRIRAADTPTRYYIIFIHTLRVSAVHAQLMAGREVNTAEAGPMTAVRWEFLMWVYI